MKRWSLDVTFEEGRAHMGIETQRHWSDLATERSTPLLFGLYSLVALFGRALHPEGQVSVAQTAWYRKQAATFRDVLAEVRRHLWGQETFPTSPTDPSVVFVPRSPLERLSLAPYSDVGNGHIAMSLRDTTTNEMANFRESQAKSLCRKTKNCREKKEGRDRSQARAKRGGATCADAERNDACMLPM
jgi:hypothetical protein